jgi:hypothetical protein
MKRTNDAQLTPKGRLLTFSHTFFALEDRLEVVERWPVSRSLQTISNNQVAIE